MRLTKKVITRTILLAIALSAGLWLLTDNGVISAPVQATIRYTIAPGVETGWVRNGAIVTDADGDVWKCDNFDAEPIEWDCALNRLPAQEKKDPADNPHIAMRLETGHWLIFEKRGENEAIDTSGNVWECASLTPGETLAANGCHRSS